MALVVKTKQDGSVNIVDLSWSSATKSVCPKRTAPPRVADAIRELRCLAESVAEAWSPGAVRSCPGV